jgi:UDP-glucuronate decarboxylase
MTKYAASSGKKNILVIGGAGFIGSFLCEELVKKNQVICLDNFVTSSMENIRLLIQLPNFQFIKHDICQPINLDDLPELQKFKVNVHGIQEIFNLACPTAQKDYKKFSIETIMANSAGVKNSLDLAVKYGAKYVFGSTAAIYGDCQDKLVNEKANCSFDHLGPRSAYNEGKRFAEMMTLKYGEYYNLTVKIARIFSTYGPRMMSSDARHIPDFVRLALANKEIEIEGEAKTKMNYIYVQDLVEGLIKLMNVEQSFTANLGGEEQQTLDQIAELIIEFTNSESKIKYQMPPEFLIKNMNADISLMKERTGWFPVVSLEKGLKMTIDYMKASKVLDVHSLV